MATKSDTVRARVEPKLKRDVERILNEIGLSTSEAITLFLRQVLLTRGLPFPVRIPNEETLAAIEEARAGGKRKTYPTADQMRDDLLDG
jgi:DNA-damage-inducible protein J